MGTAVDDGQPPPIPHEFPALPVASGAKPRGVVVVLAMPELLPVPAPYCPRAFPTPNSVEEAVKSPLFGEVLAV